MGSERCDRKNSKGMGSCLLFLRRYDPVQVLGFGLAISAGLVSHNLCRTPELNEYRSRTQRVRQVTPTKGFVAPVVLGQAK